MRRQAPTPNKARWRTGQEWTKGGKKTVDMGRIEKRSQDGESGRGVAIKSRSVL